MTGWSIAFTVGVYVSLVICLFACFRIGVMHGWLQGLLQLLVLIIFAVVHWALELFAAYRAPFYGYPNSHYVDWVPLFDWTMFGVGQLEHPCGHPLKGIPACIPISGAIIIFCSLWTARLLLTTTVLYQLYRPVLAVFMVALVALALDGYLDPIVATSFDCSPEPVVVRQALGLWHWYTQPQFADVWFSIPLFNFASWYALPATLVAFLMLFGWAANAITSGGASFLDGVLRGAIALAMATLFFSAPGANPPYAQVAVIVLVILISLWFIWRDRNTYNTHNAWRWEFVLPMFFYLLYPIAVLLFAGVFPFAASLTLVLVTIVLFLLAAFYVVSPYLKL